MPLLTLNASPLNSLLHSFTHSFTLLLTHSLTRERARVWLVQRGNVLQHFASFLPCCSLASFRRLHAALSPKVPWRNFCTCTSKMTAAHANPRHGRHMKPSCVLVYFPKRQVVFARKWTKQKAKMSFGPLLRWIGACLIACGEALC